CSCSCPRQERSASTRPMKNSDVLPFLSPNASHSDASLPSIAFFSQAPALASVVSLRQRGSPLKRPTRVLRTSNAHSQPRQGRFTLRQLLRSTSAISVLPLFLAAG